MDQLIPCPGCNRHVRQAETRCPFCDVALSLAALPAHSLPRTRLGRAATFAFGATLVGATALVACGGESDEGKKGGDGGAASGGTGGKAGSAPGGSSAVPFGGTGVGLLYGAPPAGGNGIDDIGGTSSGGTGGPAPAYGAPAAGAENTAGFSAVPLYGAAPAD